MAVRCPSTGVVDWARVARSYGTDFEEAGGEILLRREVIEFEGAEGSDNFSGGSTKGEAAPFSPVIVRTSSGEGIVADRVVVCGGLHADRLAAKGGCDPEPRIVPFRGDYLLLDESKRHLVKGNIYPVPDARYPFLGVHFTPRPDGEMWLGPNAVFAFSREGYTMGTFSLRDMWDAFSFEGFRALAWKNLAFGVDEMWRAVYLPAQVARLQRYIPELTLADVKRGPSGVRAQALDAHGSLVEVRARVRERAAAVSPCQCADASASAWGGRCARKRACACICAGLRLPPLATKRAERRGKGAALPQRPEPRGDELARNWRGHRGRGGGGIRPARATARASRQGSSTGHGRAPTMVEALARVTYIISK